MSERDEFLIHYARLNGYKFLPGDRVMFPNGELGTVNGLPVKEATLVYRVRPDILDHDVLVEGYKLQRADAVTRLGRIADAEG